MPPSETHDSAESNIRLTTLPSLPRAEDLAYGLNLARSNPDKIIELPWRAENSPRVYIIKLTCRHNIDEPSWTLHLGENDEDGICWTYDTANPDLVWSLISAEVERTAYVSPLTPHEELEELVVGDATGGGAGQNQKRQSQSGPQKWDDSAEAWGAANSRAGLGDPWNSFSFGQGSSPSPLSRMPEVIRPINDAETYTQSWGAPTEAPKTTPVKSAQTSPAETNDLHTNGEEIVARGHEDPKQNELSELPDIPAPSETTEPPPSIPIPAFHRTHSSKGFGAPNAAAPPARPAKALTQHPPAIPENSLLPLPSVIQANALAQHPPAIPENALSPLPPAISGNSLAPLPPASTPPAEVAPFASAAEASLSGHAENPFAAVDLAHDTKYSGFPAQQRSSDDPFSTAMQPPAPDTLTPDETAAASNLNKKKQKASRVNMPAVPIEAPVIQAPQPPPPIVGEAGGVAEAAAAVAAAAAAAAAAMASTLPPGAQTLVLLPAGDLSEIDGPLKSPLELPQTSNNEPPAEMVNTAPPPAMPNQAPPATPGKKSLPAPVALNREAVDTVFRSLTSPGTGFLTYNAFMFFVVREFSHFQRSNIPFAVIGFEFCAKMPNGQIVLLPQELVNEAGRRLFTAMRPLDWLAHYSSTEYAFLLPHTSVDEAARLAELMQSALSSYVLPPEMQGAVPVIVCGIAGLPDDCQHPGVLLAAAYEAKDRGKQAHSLFTLYRDLTA